MRHTHCANMKHFHPKEDHLAQKTASRHHCVVNCRETRSTSEKNAIVPCTVAPVRIGQNWVDCNTSMNLWLTSSCLSAHPAENRKGDASLPHQRELPRPCRPPGAAPRGVLTPTRPAGRARQRLGRPSPARAPVAWPAAGRRALLCPRLPVDAVGHVGRATDARGASAQCAGRLRRFLPTHAARMKRPARRCRQARSVGGCRMHDRSARHPPPPPHPDPALVDGPIFSFLVIVSCWQIGSSAGLRVNGARRGARDRAGAAQVHDGQSAADAWQRRSVPSPSPQALRTAVARRPPVIARGRRAAAFACASRAPRPRSSSCGRWLVRRPRAGSDAPPLSGAPCLEPRCKRRAAGAPRSRPRGGSPLAGECGRSPARATGRRRRVGRASRGSAKKIFFFQPVFGARDASPA